MANHFVHAEKGKNFGKLAREDAPHLQHHTAEPRSTRKNRLQSHRAFLQAPIPLVSADKHRQLSVVTK